MKSENAQKEFETYLRRHGYVGTPNAPRFGLEQMLNFYRDIRARDVSVEESGDMLLFQWGTYDWGSRPHFEVDLTRQLIPEGGDDDDMLQLHITYRLTPSTTLRALGEGNQWCRSPAELPAFVRFVIDHPALKAADSGTDVHMEVYLDRV